MKQQLHSVLLCGLPHELFHVFVEMVPYVCGDEEVVDHGSHGYRGEYFSLFPNIYLGKGQSILKDLG
jgi:hypothetical protein